MGTMVHSLISILEELLLMVLLVNSLTLSLKKSRNMNQTGDGIPAAHTTMDLSQTSTVEEPHHTPSLMMIFKLNKRSNMSQTGDGTAEAHTTTDLSPTSTPVEHLHMPSPKTIET